MTDAQINQAWDMLLAVITITLLTFGLLATLYTKIRDRQERAAEDDEARSVRSEETDSAGNERTNEPNEPPNAAAGRRTDPRTAPFGLQLSFDELVSVQAMNEYRSGVLAAGKRPTKKESIFAGFGVRGGDGPTYRRASEIYELLYSPPAPAPAAVFGQPGAYRDRDGRSISDQVAEQVIRRQG
jgi:hypothetical protein